MPSSPLPPRITTRRSNAGGRISACWRFIHPLHSALLLLLNRLGLTWEGAYRVLEIAGAVLIHLAIVTWMFALWGPGPAGITLALLAFRTYSHQGFNLIVPSNIALGIAILLWALILNKRDVRPWILISGIVALLTMHTMGRLYAAVTLALYFLLANLSTVETALAGAGSRRSRDCALLGAPTGHQAA